MSHNASFNVLSSKVAHRQFVELELADGRVIVLTCTSNSDAEKVAAVAAYIQGVEIKHRP